MYSGVVKILNLGTDPINCPLCGGEPQYDRVGKPLFTIRCSSCGCQISKSSWTETVKAWNKRQPIEDILKELFKLKEETADELRMARMASDHLHMEIFINREDAYNIAANIVAEKGRRK